VIVILVLSLTVPRRPNLTKEDNATAAAANQKYPREFAIFILFLLAGREREKNLI